MNDLKPCPFCGGTKLKIDRKSRLAGWNGLDMRVEMHTYSVRCNTCHARGGAVGGRVMNERFTRCAQLPDWATTDKALEVKAIEAWNRRAEVVYGRWDDSGRYTFPSGDVAVRCTNCGCALTESEYRLYTWNYCPICGAKMDGKNGDG